MLKMAFRNIFRQKRRSLLTALTMMGGYVLGSVALGLIDGTYNDIVDKFTRSRLGHIQVHARGYLDRPTLNKVVRNYRDVGTIIDQAPEAEAWAPRIIAAGLASVGERTDATRILGIDPVRENKATLFDKKITRGRTFSAQAAKEIILGPGLAEDLRASLGDEVVLVSQAADGSLANDIYRIVGLAETGDLAGDRTTAYLHIDDARDLFALDDAVHEIVVVSRSLKNVLNLNTSLRASLGSFPVDVQPWQEFAKSFYKAMMADKKGHEMMLIILFVVAAFGVLNTTLMSVLERRREYGILKALGTRPRQVFGLIVFEVLLLAAASVIVGAGFGLFINSLFAQHGIAVFAEPVTFGGMEFKSFISEVNLRTVVVPALTVLFSALLVSLMPAVKAARTEPARTIRLY
jgi:putative ABC transport system permease protein